MTKKELNDISKEIDSLSRRASILSSGNAIESQALRCLLKRWDFLDHQLDVALITARKNRLRLVK